MKASSGDWVVFLDHDDTLEPHALAALARYIERHDDADLVYSDEDKLDPEGCYVAPFFKPDWSPDLLRNVNYVCHLVGVRRTLYDQVGGLRAGYDGAQDYDFVLRASAEARHVGHVADVLYHWRQHPGSTASDVRVKPDAHSAGRRALEHFARDNITGRLARARCRLVDASGSIPTALREGVDHHSLPRPARTDRRLRPFAGHERACIAD